MNRESKWTLLYHTNQTTHYNQDNDNVEDLNLEDVLVHKVDQPSLPPIDTLHGYLHL